MPTDPFAKFEEFGNPFEQKNVTPNPGVANTTDPFAQFESAGNPFGEPIAAPDRTLMSSVKDAGLSLAHGVVGAGEAAVGLANIPTLGYAGKGLEAVGYDPKGLHKLISSGYSEAQKSANEQVEKADGFINTASTMIQNPSTIVHTGIESLPSAVGGGFIGKGLLKAGTKYIPNIINNVGKFAPVLAGAIGEGIIGAGSAAEQTRQNTESGTLTGKQSVLAVASGLGTGAFSLLGGTLAKKLGFADVDTMIASGKFNKDSQSIIKGIIGGGITEGMFEELPQSAQEQIFANAALDKPLLEGVGKSAATGLLTGFAMGGGANALASKGQVENITKEQKEINKQVDNIFSFGEDKVNTTLQTLQDNVAKNAELLGNQEALDKYAMAANIDPDILVKQLVDDNNRNDSLIKGIQKRFTDQQLTKDQEIANLSPEQKQVLDAQNRIKTQREESALNINEQINGINEQLKTLRQQAAQEQDAEKRNLLYENVFGLIDNRDALLDKQKQVVATTEFTAPKKADEIRNEKEAFYQQLWPGGVNKDAKESATLFANSDLSRFDQIVNDKNQAQLNKLLEDIIVEQNPQARQTMYEQLFMEPRIKDAAESAAVFASQGVDADMLQRRKELQQTISNITQESDPTVRQQLYDQMFLQPGVKNAEESAKIFNANIQTLAQQEEDRKQREGEQFYNDLFAQNQQPVNPVVNNEVANKTAEESAKTFEQAGMGNGQTSPFTNERQVELTDNQQIIVDKNNFEIAKLKQTYNTTIDRDERINILNQIDELAKVNAGIRTPVENTWAGAEDYFTLNKEGEEDQTYFQLENNQKEPANFTFNNGKLETSLGTIINQVKSAEGLTGQLAKFLGDFIASSKLDIKTIIDPTIPSANYTGGKINTITLRDPAQFATSLHEITHAVTSREMKANPTIRKQVFLLMKRVENKAIKEALITPAQLELLRTARTSKEYKENISTEFKYGNVAYGLLNENEFLAQAMGSEQFQRLLKATTIADQGMLKNAWDAFIEIVLNALGIQQTNKNVFGEALNIIAKLASQENVEQTSNSFVLENFESPEIGQKISNAEYTRMFNERDSYVSKFGQALRKYGHESIETIDKYFGVVSSRLRKIDPSLPIELRNMDFRIGITITDALKKALPILHTKMSKEDRYIWDKARVQGDTVKIDEIANKYGITNDLHNVRGVLDKIHSYAKDVGLDIGYIEDYWPRVIKDHRGFLMEAKGITEWPIIEKTIKIAADKLGMSVERYMLDFPDQAADITSNLILGRNVGIGGTGNTKTRMYDTVPTELLKYYMDSDAALMAYIYGMIKKIEARRFFGKVPERINKLKAEGKRLELKVAELQKSESNVRNNNPEEAAKINSQIKSLSSDLYSVNEKLDDYKNNDRDYTESIGHYVNDLIINGKISKEQQKTVVDILKARFNEHGTTGLVNAYKNFAYIDVLGSPTSAITQIGDLAWSAYVGEVWTPRGFNSNLKNTVKAIFKKSNITKEDLGIERIAQEFADSTTLGDAVSWVFRKVGLENMDRIGKEVLINNAFDKYKAMASTENGRAKLIGQIKQIFGRETDSVIQDLLTGKPSPNVKMLLYHRLLDFQPVALSEMPAPYLDGGNGRVAYMLKMYTIKQVDVFRNEVYNEIKEGATTGDHAKILNAIGNMTKLLALLTLANAGADELKDLILGKETKFKDHVIDNFLSLGGASKYMKAQVQQEGIGSGIMGQILPPFKFLNSASKDLIEFADHTIANDTIKFDHARILDSLPIAGKWYYWHYGRGEDYKKSNNEQEFSSVGKEVGMFKRQLENADNKREFIYANIGKFKQMKLHENFQSALSRNQAVINKLKKVPETTNVIERLGKLKEQREVLLDRYFEASKGLNTSN